MVWPASSRKRGEEKREEADYVLSAAGRVPETEKLLGPGTELAMERGRITVDSNFETSMEGYTPSET